jgi:hypothetical protein
MAWDIWCEMNDNYGTIGYYSNVSFGSVFNVNTDFNKVAFYNLWSKSSFKSPCDMEHYELQQKTNHLLHFIGYEENIFAAMNVYHKGNLIFTKGNKIAYDNLGFSPYAPALESFTDDDFDILYELIETANEVMTHHIVSGESNETFFEGKDFKVVMTWEILED